MSTLQGGYFVDAAAAVGVGGSPSEREGVPYSMAEPVETWGCSASAEFRVILQFLLTSHLREDWDLLGACSGVCELPGDIVVLQVDGGIVVCVVQLATTLEFEVTGLKVLGFAATAESRICRVAKECLATFQVLTRSLPALSPVGVPHPREAPHCVTDMSEGV